MVIQDSFAVGTLPEHDKQETGAKHSTTGTSERNPEVERQASNMQHDVNEIMSRPEVQTELRRMQRDMEGVRRQLERQSNK